MSESKITIKCSNSTTSDISIDDFSQTVLSLKSKIETSLSIPANQQRLIYRGKVLKDENSLEFYEITAGQVIHLVKGAPKPTGAEGPASPSVQPVQPTAIPNTPPQVAPVANPFGNLFGSTPSSSQQPSSNQFNPFQLGGAGGFGAGGFGAGGGMPNMSQMQEQMMRNPEMMQQMMNSPMMASLLDNPEVSLTTVLISS